MAESALVARAMYCQYRHARAFRGGGNALVAQVERLVVHLVGAHGGRQAGGWAVEAGVLSVRERRRRLICVAAVHDRPRTLVRLASLALPWNHFLEQTPVQGEGRSCGYIGARPHPTRPLTGVRQLLSSAFHPHAYYPAPPRPIFTAAATVPST